MKKFFAYFMAAVIVLLMGAALYLCENYTAYNLAYIFAFLFIGFYAVLTPGTVLLKAAQIIVYALIMTAQILLNTLLIRTMQETDAYELYKLLGVLIVLVPFFVRLLLFPRGGTEEDEEEA